MKLLLKQVFRPVQVGDDRVAPPRDPWVPAEPVKPLEFEGRVVKLYDRIDTIGDKGDIREHVLSGRTLWGRPATLCGIAVMRTQNPAGNTRCGSCARSEAASRRVPKGEAPGAGTTHNEEES